MKSVKNNFLRSNFNFSGLCSTQLLHNITKDKYEEGHKVKLYTVDSDKHWLDKFNDLQSEYHKFILVNSQWT